MKRVGIAIAACAALALGSGPMTAWAARAPAAITKAQRDQGAKDAPAAVTRAGLACTVTDSYFINSGVDAATKAKLSFYEVACSEGMGYVVQAAPDSAKAFNCISIASQADTQGEGALRCRLDANLDPKQGLAPLIVKSGRACTVSAARPMGSTAAGDTFFEVACGPGVGYVVKTAANGALAPEGVIDCAQMMGGQTECTLTTKPQIFTALGGMVAQGGSACTVSDARYVGSSPSATFYEVACGAGNPGYMINATLTGAFTSAIECTKAQQIGGGCKLTDVSVAEQAEAATYTGLAKAAGYPCEVSKYRFLGIDETTKSEVVELACSNRPDGGVGLFPTTAGSTGKVYDCIVSQAVGVSCNLSQPSAAFAKYTAGLASQGRTTCQVSNAKWLAATNSGTDLIETACSDGLPGFVMSISRANGATTELLTCGQSRTAGAPCTFPTNTAAR
jgi:hypothetical protein